MNKNSTKQFAHKQMKHTGQLISEIIAGIVGILFLLVIAVVWRISTGPLSLDFALGYIEETLESKVEDADISLERASIHWPDFKGPIQMELTGLSAASKSDQRSLFSAEKTTLLVSQDDLLTGKFSPIGLSIIGPTLYLVRDETGRFSLGLDNSLGVNGERHSWSLEYNKDMPPDTFMEAIDNAISSWPILKNMQRFGVEKAALIYDDRVLNISRPAAVATIHIEKDDLLLTLKWALMEEESETAARMSGRFLYNRNTQISALSVDIKNFTPHSIAEFSGQLVDLSPYHLPLSLMAEARFDKTWDPIDLTIDLSSVGGEIKSSLIGANDAPLTFTLKDLHARASYDRQKKGLSLTLSPMVLDSYHFSAALPLAITDEGYRGSISIKGHDIPVNTLLGYIPKMERPFWVTGRVKNGTITTANVTLPFTLTKDEAGILTPSTDQSKITADFSVKDVDVDYRAPLWPFSKLAGTGRYKDDTLTIDVPSANLKNLSVSETQVLIKNISSKTDGTVDIDLKIKGQLPDVLSYTSNEPLELTKNLGVAPSETKGIAAIDAKLFFPMIKELRTEQVKATVTADIENAHIPNVSQGLDLNTGKLKLKANNSSIQVSGTALMDTTPTTLDWTYNFNEKPFKNKLHANLTTHSKIRRKLDLDFPDYITGPLPIVLDYIDYNDNRALIDVTADLEKSRLTIDELFYLKPEGQKGTLSLQAETKNGRLKRLRNVDVTAPALNFNSGNFVFDGTTFISGAIPQITLGKSKIALKTNRSNSGYDVSFSGPTIDVRPFFKDKEEKAARNRQESDETPSKTKYYITFNTQELLISDQGHLDDVKGYVVLAGDNLARLDVDAATGKEDFSLRYRPTPQTGLMRFDLDAKDAGKILKALDLYDNMRGGHMKIAASATKHHAFYDLTGRMTIDGFRVKHAPVLAKLFSALSLKGFSNLINNDGISFKRLETNFDWQSGLGRKKGEGRVLTLRKGRTSGSELGLTFEGEANLAQKTSDITGTIVPVSTLNKIVGGLPLIGNIISGGKNSALFAATYAIKGNLNDPKIIINPLSVLTPGILRKILFEEKDKNDDSSAKKDKVPLNE